MIISLPAFLVVSLLATSPQTPALEPAAPFRVVESAGRDVRVDIGVDRKEARWLRRATVLTVGGPVDAVLVRTERMCEDLCADGNKECHFESIVRATRPIEKAFAVLAGRPSVELGARFETDAWRDVGDEADWLARKTDKVLLGGDLRWTRFADGVHLVSPGYGRDFYSPAIALASCFQQTISPFTVLRCGGDAELLYDGADLVAASFSDYSDRSVQPQLRLRLRGQDAYLIRLGLKGEVVPALLIRSNSWWRLEFNRAGYALLC